MNHADYQHLLNDVVIVAVRSVVSSERSQQPVKYDDGKKSRDAEYHNH